MDSESARAAQSWLTERGVTRVGDGWLQGEEECTANDLAHEWTEKALEDPDLDEAGRVGVAVGLLDLLDQYAVTMYLKTAPMGAVAEGVFWDAYRRRLEAVESAEPVTYSLWVDWFEDPMTAEAAFGQVMGVPGDLTDGVLRRNRRVLAVSGPVPWVVKAAVYEAAAGVPELHLALFHGLLGSRYDVYGDLDASAALGLLRRLELPEGTANVDVLLEELEARR